MRRCETVCLHEATHSVSVPGGHQVVHQRVDGSTETGEDPGHHEKIKGCIQQFVIVCTVSVCVIVCTVSVCVVVCTVSVCGVVCTANGCVIVCTVRTGS